MLHPGEFVLGSTLERIGVPDDLVGRIEGKSSLGRLGLIIHSTAGFIDAGFDGHITLELTNIATLPITLYPGMKIGQVSFMQMTTPGRQALRQRRPGLEVPGPARPDTEPLLRELRPLTRRPLGAKPVPGVLHAPDECRGESVPAVPESRPTRVVADGTQRRASGVGRGRLDEPAGEIDDVVRG